MTTSTMAAISVALAATFAVAATQVSFAQQAPEPRTPPAATITVSDADLETFASIYVDLIDTASKFEAEMESATTEEQALEIQGRAQTESIAKVEQRGWTPERFNSVSEAINSDPRLTEKAVKLIEQR